MVKVPYLFITAIFLFVALLIYLAHLPEIVPHDGSDKSPSPNTASADLFSHSHLIKGVVAQFFYVGAQVGVAGFLIRFAKQAMPDSLAISCCASRPDLQLCCPAHS
jgi:FHS family L-fucose permease-like MFS transporter